MSDHDRSQASSAPSIINPTVEVYWVHAPRYFAIVTATSTYHAVQLFAVEAGGNFDPETEDYTMGKIVVDNHPRVQVGIEIMTPEPS